MGFTIAVLVRQVPDPNAIRVNRATGTLQLSGQMVISSFDEYAIEEAIRLKEAYGGEVTVVAVGPPGAKDALSRALAMGADKATLVSVDQSDSLDSPALAHALVETLTPMSPDIILTGQISDDYGSGEVGPFVAELMGIPQVSSATSIEVEGTTLTILRDTEDGKQQVTVEPPVLIMAMTGLNEPRYPSLKGIMAAKKKPLETTSRSEGEPSRYGWSAPFVEDKPSSGVIVQDTSPQEAARQLVGWLRDNKLI